MRVRKLPVEVEARRYDGTNGIELVEWMGEDNDGTIAFTAKEHYISIRTLEGEMLAARGDFIIKGVNGEFYPCKPDIFWKTYEVVS